MARRARDPGRKLAIEGGRPIRDQFLVFGRPVFAEEEIAAVAEVLRSGWPGLGPRTQEFERAFAEYCGARHAVAVSSCTAGLHLALVAAGVGEGHEVITTAMTFAATVNAILMAGARPVLVDIDEETLNLDLDAVERAITSRTRAVLPVHFGGLPCDLDRLRGLAEARGLVVLEDAAHAVGAVYHGRRIGGHGNLAAFSFYSNKNLTTVEGGMVTTDDDRLAEELRIRRLHGLSSDAWKRFGTKAVIPSHVTRQGFKYNLTDLQAVIGQSQLSRLEGFLATREKYAAIYDAELAGLPFDRQFRPTLGGPDRHGLHLYIVLLRLDELSLGRDHVMVALREENIGVAAHYMAISEHPHFQRVLGCGPGDFPVAERIASRTMSLPLSPGMTEDDVYDVVDAMHSVLSKYRAPAAAERHR
jgi:dTDP-4-amino-4,6-dideoxygalactose transaminase